MSEFETPESRKNFSKDLDIILYRQATWMGNVLAYDTTEAARLRDSFTVEQVDDSSRFGYLPAQVEVNKDETRRTLFFDMPTFELLGETFGQTHHLTSLDLAEIYIGTGIAGHFLKSRVNRVREKGKTQFDNTLNVLTDPSSVTEAIIGNELIPARLRRVVVQSIMQSHSNRIGQINVLRFAFGMVYLQAEEPVGENTHEELESSRENRSMKQMGKTLIRSLEKKPIYLKAGKKLKKSVEHSETVFADTVGEFEIAACYPMGWQEIDNLLKISK